MTIKWYLPEDHSAIAQRLITENWRLYAPDLLFIEIGNIAWKHVRYGAITLKDAVDIVHAALLAGIETHESSYLLGRAIEIGIETGRTVYDSLYIALSDELSVPVITADFRMYNALKDGPFAPNVIWIENLPAIQARSSE